MSTRILIRFQSLAHKCVVLGRSPVSSVKNAVTGIISCNHSRLPGFSFLSVPHSTVSCASLAASEVQVTKCMSKKKKRTKAYTDTPVNDTKQVAGGVEKLKKSRAAVKIQARARAAVRKAMIKALEQVEVLGATASAGENMASSLKREEGEKALEEGEVTECDQPQQGQVRDDFMLQVHRDATEWYREGKESPGPSRRQPKQPKLKRTEVKEDQNLEEEPENDRTTGDSPEIPQLDPTSSADGKRKEAQEDSTMASPASLGLRSPPAVSLFPVRASKPDSLPRAAIRIPSAASGGVPEPHPNYLLQASSSTMLAPYLRPLLLVIDLNGTLLYRPNPRLPKFFVERPHASQFLAYCLQTFRVVVWSSAKPDNVAAMVNALVPYKLRHRLVAIWSRQHFNLSPEDYSARTMCYKRLTRLWQDPVVQASYPREELCNRQGWPVGETASWNQSNTVLVDDTAEKGRSEPYNCITLPEFTGGNEGTAVATNGSQPPVDLVYKERDLAILPLVCDYINNLALYMDVSSYVREHPFRMDEARQKALRAAKGPVRYKNVLCARYQA